MACATIFDGFKIATEHLSSTVYDTPYIQSDLITKAFKVEEFPPNVGITVTDFKVGRTMPADDEPTWTPLTINSSTGAVVAESCSDTYNDITLGYDESTYTPKKYGLRGPMLCRDDFKFVHNPGAFLAKYVQGLTKYAKQTRANQWLKQYIAKVPKAVADASFSVSELSALTIATIGTPTSELTYEMLEEAASYLMNEGGGDVINSGGYITLPDDGVSFNLLIGEKAKNRLLRNNSDLRADIRYADPKNLLAKAGAKFRLASFNLIPWLTPPRYKVADGGLTFERVNTWEAVAATNGYKSALTSAYKAAEYEAAIVLHPDVMIPKVVRPLNSVGGVDWKPETAYGEWAWIDGSDAQEGASSCSDPFHDRGRHFAKFAEAFADGPNTKAGMWILYKRCTSNFDVVACS